MSPTWRRCSERSTSSSASSPSSRNAMRVSYESALMMIFGFTQVPSRIPARLTLRIARRAGREDLGHGSGGDSDLVEERPGESHPVGGAFQLAHERGRLEKDGSKVEHREPFRQRRVQPLAEVDGGRPAELEIEDFGP